MSFLFGEDTSEEVEAILLRRYRQMSALQKLRQVEDLNRSVQSLAMARIKARYPNESKREHQLRLASLWLDDDTMRTVFHWNPAEKGY